MADPELTKERVNEILYGSRGTPTPTPTPTEEPLTPERVNEILYGSRDTPTPTPTEEPLTPERVNEILYGSRDTPPPAPTAPLADPEGIAEEERIRLAQEGELSRWGTEKRPWYSPKRRWEEFERPLETFAEEVMAPASRLMATGLERILPGEGPEDRPWMKPSRVLPTTIGPHMAPLTGASLIDALRRAKEGTWSSLRPFEAKELPGGEGEIAPELARVWERITDPDLKGPWRSDESKDRRIRRDIEAVSRFRERPIGEQLGLSIVDPLVVASTVKKIGMGVKAVRGLPSPTKFSELQKEFGKHSELRMAKELAFGHIDAKQAKANALVEPLASADEKYAVRFAPNPQMAIGRLIARVPGLRHLIGKMDPTKTADTPYLQALIIRSDLVADGNFHADQIMVDLGNPANIFGDIVTDLNSADYGKLTGSGLANNVALPDFFRGKTLQQIAENQRLPQYKAALTPAMQDWLDTARRIEEALIDQAKYHGVDIQKMKLPENKIFATRKLIRGPGDTGPSGQLLVKTDREGNVLDAILVKDKKVKVRKGKRGFEQERVIGDVAKAMAEGYRYTPYNEALAYKAKQIYELMADQRVSEWVVRNAEEHGLTSRSMGSDLSIKTGLVQAEDRVKYGKKTLGDIAGILAGRGITTRALGDLRMKNPEVAERLVRAMEIAPAQLTKTVGAMGSIIKRQLGVSKTAFTRAVKQKQRQIATLQRFRIAKESSKEGERLPSEWAGVLERDYGVTISDLGNRISKNPEKWNKAVSWSDFMKSIGNMPKELSVPPARLTGAGPSVIPMTLEEIQHGPMLRRSFMMPSSPQEAPIIDVPVGITRKLLSDVIGELGASADDARALAGDIYKQAFSPAFRGAKKTKEIADIRRIVAENTAEWRKVQDSKAGKWRNANKLENIIKEEGELKLTTGLRGLDNLAFKGEKAKVFKEEMEKAFPKTVKVSFLSEGGPIHSVLTWIRRLNAIQQVFALAGDGSLFMIHLIGVLTRHPVVAGKTGKTWGAQVVRALYDPKSALQFHEGYLQKHSRLLRAWPGFIASNSGIEATEAMGKGGLLKAIDDSVRGATGVGRVVWSPWRPFARFLDAHRIAFETAMDVAGINMLKGLQHLGDTPIHKRVVIDEVNQFRGLMDTTRLGLSPQQRAFEGALLLAPRYRRATAALYISFLKGGLATELFLQAFGSLIFGLHAQYIAISIGLGHLRGHSSERIKKDLAKGLNPESGEYVLWRIGGTMVGPGSKIVSDMRFLAKAMADPSDLLSIGMENPGFRWARGQLGMVPGMGISILSGRTYLGEPLPTREMSLEAVQNLSIEVGENFIPLWVSSMAFEGGSAGDMAARGMADYIGWRSRPENTMEILGEASPDVLGVFYDEAEPFERDYLRKVLDDRLMPLEEKSRKRGYIFSEYFNGLRGIEDEFQATIRSATGTRREIANAYYDAKNVKKGAEGELRKRVQPDFTEPDINDPNLNKAALAQYWLLFDDEKRPDLRDPQTGEIDSDRLEVEIIRLERGWSLEQRMYVVRNTNKDPIPIRVLRSLSFPTQRRMRVSHNARVAHLKTTGGNSNNYRKKLVPYYENFFFGDQKNIAPEDPEFWQETKERISGYYSDEQ